MNLSIKDTKATPEAFWFRLLCQGRGEVAGNDKAPACYDHSASRQTLPEGQCFNMAVPRPVESLNHSLLQVLSL